MKETLWEKNLNFVKDVPLIYVNFITIVVTVYETKILGITFILALLFCNNLQI